MLLSYEKEKKVEDDKWEIKISEVDEMWDAGQKKKWVYNENRRRAVSEQGWAAGPAHCDEQDAPVQYFIF